jgi:hypothetical protein
LIYRLLIAGSLYALVLPWGRAAAAGTTLLCGALLLGTGLAANAVFGALALALLGLALLARATRAEPSPRSRMTLLLAGVLLGAAVLFRFDFAPAVLLACAPLLRGVPRSAWKPLGAGLILGILPYLPHLLVVGPARIARVASDLSHTGPGHRLPLPAVSTDAGQLLAAEVICTLALLLGGFAAARRRDRKEAATLLAIGLFVLALQPYPFSRADGPHIVPVSAIAVALAPVLVVHFMRIVRPTVSGRGRVVAAVATAAVVAGALAPNLLRNPARHQLGLVLGVARKGPSFEIRNGSRSFRVNSAREARGMEAVIGEIERTAMPGDRLFVGPRDLRRTKYADTFLYYLLPDLRPASYYMELAPETANRPGSGLAKELEQADFLVFNRRWDRLDEPNASRRFGSPAPNAVVRRLFCRRTRHGDIELYERC